MKKNLKVYYAKVPNMGDILNKNIIEKIWGYNVVRKTYLTGVISGIGSGLGNYTYEDNLLKNILKFIFGKFHTKTYIWGTGFVKYKDKDTKFWNKNLQFCAVRGILSKERIEKIIGKKIDIPTGDAGILASYLLDEMPEKKYSVGIIAHYKEKNEPIFEKLKKQFDNSVFIDVQDTPLNVTRKIAECETIISSSLHGLIIADSLNVPNVHIVVTDNLLGDGFKFDDYYSAYGLEHHYININKDKIHNLEDIKNNYKITAEMVEQKKKSMIESFPFSKVK